MVKDGYQLSLPSFTCFSNYIFQSEQKDPVFCAETHIVPQIVVQFGRHVSEDTQQRPHRTPRCDISCLTVFHTFLNFCALPSKSGHILSPSSVTPAGLTCSPLWSFIHPPQLERERESGRSEG